MLLIGWPLKSLNINIVLLLEPVRPRFFSSGLWGLIFWYSVLLSNTPTKTGRQKTSTMRDISPNRTGPSWAGIESCCIRQISLQYSRRIPPITHLLSLAAHVFLFHVACCVIHKQGMWITQHSSLLLTGKPFLKISESVFNRCSFFCVEWFSV